MTTPRKPFTWRDWISVALIVLGLGLAALGLMHLLETSVTFSRIMVCALGVLIATVAALQLATRDRPRRTWPSLPPRDDEPPR
ncbi:MAG: hypothetical protein JWN36_1075 [Microbacteriaceae bacterium]|nr:hypothetical protein [Microbacteriaceae bacterium]